MRRLTVVQLLPALAGGGVERSTLEIAAALVAAGHRSVVVSAGGRLVPALERGGSEHLALAIGAKSPRLLPAALGLRRALRALAPDIVHVRSRLPAWLARWALRGQPPGTALVSTVHGLNSPGRYSGVMRRADAVVCVSEAVRAHVLRHWPDTDPARLQVIPRGVDPASFPRGFALPDDWRLRLGGQHPELAGGRLLLLPGRGTRLKGHADAIRLLAALRAKGEDVRLWLLGADQPGRARYRRELEALARALGVRAALAITRPREDIREAYAAADLVLQLSSRPEAFGRTALEALAMGRPVLGWDHGGVGELLRRCFPEGAVPPADTGALAGAARALLERPAPEPAMPPYSLAAMQSATLALYERLVR